MEETLAEAPHPILTLSIEPAGMPTPAAPAKLREGFGMSERRPRTMTFRRVAAVAAVPAIGLIGWRATGPILAQLLHAGCTAVAAVRNTAMSRLLSKFSAPLKGPIQVAIDAEARRAAETLEAVSPSRSVDEEEEDYDEESEDGAFSSAPGSAEKSGGMRRSPLRVETESALSELATLMAKLESLDASVISRGEAAGQTETPATMQSRRLVLTKLGTDMDCLNAGLVNPKSTGRKKRSSGASRHATPPAAAAEEASGQEAVEPSPAPTTAARHFADDTPPVLAMRQIPNTPMMSTGGPQPQQRARPVLAPVDGNTPATTPAAAAAMQTGLKGSAKPPRGGSAGPRPPPQQQQQQQADAAPTADEPAESASAPVSAESPTDLSVSRAAEAKMDDAMAMARKAMEVARVKKTANKAKPPPAPQQNGFCTPCASAGPSPTRGGAEPSSFFGRHLPTIMDGPGSNRSTPKASSESGSSAEKRGNKFGGVLSVGETESLVEEEVARRVRLATAESSNRAFALEAQCGQLKARVAELLVELAERDEAAAADRAQWAALRGDAATLAKMSVAELQVLVRGQEEALAAAKEAMQRRSVKAAQYYL